MSCETLQGKYAEKLELKNEELQERIDKAIEYIKSNIDNTGWLEIGSSCVNELLEILGDKENG